MLQDVTHPASNAVDARARSPSHRRLSRSPSPTLLKREKSNQGQMRIERSYNDDDQVNRNNAYPRRDQAVNLESGEPIKRERLDDMQPEEMFKRRREERPYEERPPIPTRQRGNDRQAPARNNFNQRVPPPRNDRPRGGPQNGRFNDRPYDLPMHNGARNNERYVPRSNYIHMPRNQSGRLFSLMAFFTRL